MKQYILLLIIGVIAALHSCAPMPKPTKVLWNKPWSSLAQFAVDNCEKNVEFEVVRDTSIVPSKVEIPFYSLCQETTKEYTAIPSEVNNGSMYVKERTCTEMEGDFIAGFVWVLTQDVHSSKKEWVSAPCLLFDKDSRQRIWVKKTLISLNKHGNGEYIFIQTEPSLGDGDVPVLD